MGRRLWHWFGPLPDTLAPSDEIVYAGQAFLGAAVVLACTYVAAGAALLWLLHHPILPHLLAWTQTLLSWLTWGRQRYQGDYWDGIGFDLRASFAGTLLVSTAMGVLVASSSLKPQTHWRYLSGPRRLEGRAALDAAQRLDAGRMGGKTVRMHPELPRPLAAWQRHVIVVGSVGSGKTQILFPIVRRIVRMPKSRALIFDSKGDFSGALLHKKNVRLLCPWDARTSTPGSGIVWDVAQDVRSITDIQALASALIPHEDNSAAAFWKNAAMDVLAGVLTSCIQEHGTDWGWSDVADKLQWGQEDLQALLLTHAPASAALLAGKTSSTSASLLATLSVETQIVQTLARGWSDPNAERLSLRQWCSDAPMAEDGPRILLVQSGPAPRESAALLGAIVNTIAGTVNSPLLPDDQTRQRFLILDEVQAMGAGAKRIPELLERARSKGFSVCLGLQDLSQLSGALGEHFAKSLPGIVGTIVLCQLQLGATREQVSGWFGKARYAQTTHSHNTSGQGSGVNRSTSETEALVVQPHELTDLLGVKLVKKKPVIRAILAAGGDLLTLDWPITPVPKRSPARVPALWTLPLAPDTPTTTSRKEREENNSPAFAPEPDPLALASALIHQQRLE